MQKFLTFLLFGVILGAIVVLSIPNLLAHDEDVLLMKIAELEKRLQFVYKTNQYLSPADFPNTNNLYGWRASDSGNFTTVYGEKELTLHGSLRREADHLGNRKDCKFDGANTYLSSSDSTFAFTGTFSISMWAYRSNWSTNFGAGSQGLIGRSSGGPHGWYLYGINDQDNIAFRLGTSGKIETFIDCSPLSSGWHHFALVRNHTAYTALYIDGLLLAKTYISDNITPEGNLGIGSYSTVAQWNGCISEVWIHNGTAWKSEEVKKIYARGSRQWATVRADGNLDVNLPLEGVWFQYMPTIDYFRTSGAPTFSRNGGQYMVSKNTVYFQGGFGIGVNSWGNGTGELFTSLPILAKPGNIQGYFGGGCGNGSAIFYYSEINEQINPFIGGILYGIAITPTSADRFFFLPQSGSKSGSRGIRREDIKSDKDCYVNYEMTYPVDSSLDRLDRFIPELKLYLSLKNGFQFMDFSNFNRPVTSVGHPITNIKENSCYFDGKKSFLRIPGSEDFNLGGEDFTLECWFKWTEEPTHPNPIYFLFQYFGLEGQNGWNYYGLSINNQELTFYIGSEPNALKFKYLKPMEKISKNVWYHCAIVREINSLKIYLNGQKKAHDSINFAFKPTLNPAFRIGGVAQETDNWGWFTGYIADFKVYKGIALYKENFVPPAR